MAKAAASAALLSDSTYPDLRSFTVGLVGIELLIGLLYSLTTLATGDATISFSSSFAKLLFCFSILSTSVATELCMNTGCELRLDDCTDIRCAFSLA